MSRLTEEQLQHDGNETAQYSIHCLGMVFDGVSRSLFLADGNGPLMKGGSMEFVSLPFRRLPAGVQDSTSLSRWDRDEAAAVSLKKREGKQKKKKLAGSKRKRA